MYKLLVLIFLIPLTITATERKGKYTKSKTINKEFIVNPNATLNVSNKFGNIDITSWNENKIVINVTITTNGDDEDKIKKRLDQIDVDFESSSSYVSAKTMIEKSSSSWNLWGKNNNVQMEINYKVKMPKTNNADLTNDYGGITLDKLEGTAKISCDYGKINIGELLNKSNSINIDYTNNSTIEYMKDGDINADYSTLHVEKTGSVKLSADYSQMSFGKIANLDYNSDYGSLKIDESENIVGKSDYMNATIGKLLSSGKFNMDYGSLKINDLGNNFKNISVESSYTQLKFGINPTTSFNIEATLDYGGFKYGNGFTFNKEIIKSSSKQYEGYYNSPNSSNKIYIKSSYGSVSFTNN